MNILSTDDILARLDQLGEQSANGEDALPNLGMEMAEWAQQGSVVFSHEKPHAPGLIDIKDAFIRYAETRGKAMHKRSEKSNSIDAQVSKLGVFFKVGANPNWNGPDFFQRVTDYRNDLVGGDLKVKPAYDAMLSAGRALLGAFNDKDNSRNDLTDDEIHAAIVRKGAADPTAISLYQSADNIFHKLLTENLEMSDATKKIREAIKIKLAALKKAEAIAEWQSQGAELGVTSAVISE